MSKLPNSVRVGAFDFRIEDWSPTAAHAERKFGDFCSLQCLIRVDSSVNPMKVLDTLIHEINHAIYWAYCLEAQDNEERTVGTMSTAWVQVYRDNPDLIRFIESTVNPTNRSIP